MKTVYVGQSITNLRLALYRRTLEQDLFRIFQERYIERKKYRADLWIIGSSHVINIRAQNASISEVLTADKNTLPSDGRIKLIDEIDNNRCACEISDRLTYQVELELLNYSEEDFYHEQSNLFDRERLFRLRHCFPPCENVITAPITVIDVIRADEEMLNVRTFHSYVEDLAVVVTHSTLQII